MFDSSRGQLVAPVPLQRHLFSHFSCFWVFLIVKGARKILKTGKFYCEATEIFRAVTVLSETAAPLESAFDCFQIGKISSFCYSLEQVLTHSRTSSCPPDDSSSMTPCSQMFLSLSVFHTVKRPLYFVRHNPVVSLFLTVTIYHNVLVHLPPTLQIMTY